MTRQPVGGATQNTPAVITVALRDLRWRARRFVVAGAGAATVFALTLVMAGLVSSFRAEPARVLAGVGADVWVVPEGVEGVFTTVSVVPQSLAAELARDPAVRRADPLVVLHHTVRLAEVEDVNVVGYAPGGLGTPRLAEGRLPAGRGEVVADRALGVELGRSFALAGEDVRVVGRTEGQTVNAGQPLLFLPLHDAQALLAKGAPVASAVVTAGRPGRVPPGYVAQDRAVVREGMLRPLEGALQSLELTLILLWCVAGLVIGSVVYLSALERARDFAVHKATGWSDAALGGGLALQSLVLSVLASVVGVALAGLLVPLFPLTFEVPLAARLLLPAVAAVVGLLASLAGLRRAVAVEPGLAFGGP